MLRIAIAALVAGGCLCGLAVRVDRADASSAPIEIEPAWEPPHAVAPVGAVRDAAAGLALPDRRHRGTAH